LLFACWQAVCEDEGLSKEIGHGDQDLGHASFFLQLKISGFGQTVFARQAIRAKECDLAPSNRRKKERIATKVRIVFWDMKLSRGKTLASSSLFGKPPPVGS
jgi:hypothetical protein